jgi:hypothetical protein
MPSIPNELIRTLNLILDGATAAIDLALFAWLIKNQAFRLHSWRSPSHGDRLARRNRRRLNRAMFNFFMALSAVQVCRLLLTNEPQETFARLLPVDPRLVAGTLALFCMFSAWLFGSRILDRLRRQASQPDPQSALHLSH